VAQPGRHFACVFTFPAPLSRAGFGHARPTGARQQRDVGRLWRSPVVFLRVCSPHRRRWVERALATLDLRYHAGSALAWESALYNGESQI
jgi:hypothetical protein